MDTRIQVRSNKVLKQEASALLDSMGLDLTTAVNMLLRQIVNTGRFPFIPTVPDFEKAVLSTLDEPAIPITDSEFEKLIEHV